MSFITLFTVDTTGGSGMPEWVSNIMPIAMIILLVVVFFFMYRSNKKQEQKANEMRNNLEVGDEVTTIGGIVGEVVSIKEETVTIETSRDRTKIRFLRSAIRSVDVSAAQKRGEVPMNDAEKPEKSSAKIEKAEKVEDKKKDQAKEQTEAPTTENEKK